MKYIPVRIRKYFVIAILISISLFISLLTGEVVESSSDPDSLFSEETFEDTTQYDSLYYYADSIYYDAEREIINLNGNAKIEYHNSEIQADTISMDIKNEQAYSLGQSYLKDGAHFLIGDRIFYDLDSQWGLIEQGASSFDKGFYYGREIRKVDEEVYDVDEGIFTTCDSRYPHFYIKTGKLRLYKDDKIVAKPIVFMVNHFPVLAFPFGTFTIKRGRKSGILVPSPGYNENDGKYIENIAYYYAFRDHADLLASFDYYEKTGWKANFEIDYIKRYLFKGDFLASMRKFITGPEQSRYEWHLKSRHHSDFSNDRSFDSNLEFVSSKRVWVGNVNIDERLSEKITSRMAYKQPFLGSYLNVNAQYVDDFKNEKKDITLPSISYSLPTKPIYEFFNTKENGDLEDKWWSNFSYSYSLKAIHLGDINKEDPTLSEVLYQTKKDSTGNYVVQHNAGIKQRLGLSYTYKAMGWLNISQNVYYNEAWFDRDRENNKLVRGNDFYLSSNLSYSLYGLREIPNPYLRAVRHIFSPSASFSYYPDFTDNDRFYSFGGISLRSSDRQRRLNFRLENKWQLKLGKPESEKVRKLNDFIRINSAISYNFDAEDRGYSDISHTVRMNPGTFRRGILSFAIDPQLNLSQDTYGISLKGFDYQKWDMGVKSWSLNVSSSLKFSGDAVYLDYFPEPENRMTSNRFFQSDSLLESSADKWETIEELETLEQNKTNWSLSFSHSFRTNKRLFEINDYTSDLRINAQARITKNWYVSYKNYFDLKDEELVSQEIELTRELHCWKIVFRYTKQRGYWSYSFKLFNLALPEDLKFSTSDNRRN